MGDNVGAGVVSGTGVAPVGDTEGTAPPGDDVQPAIHMPTTTRHNAESTKDILIAASPLIMTTDTRDDIYDFIWG